MTQAFRGVPARLYEAVADVYSSGPSNFSKCLPVAVDFPGGAPRSRNSCSQCTISKSARNDVSELRHFEIVFSGLFRSWSCDYVRNTANFVLVFAKDGVFTLDLNDDIHKAAVITQNGEVAHAGAKDALASCGK